jgi:hypothetical protein
MAKNSQNKTVPTNISVKEYLSGLKNESQRKDAEKLAHMMENITGKPGVMWGGSIIGFDQVHYKYESGREGDMGAIGFAPRKSNLTIYLVDGTSKYGELLNRLGPHKTGKVCLYIKRLSDVDQTILEELIRDSYQYVVAHKNDMHRAE